MSDLFHALFGQCRQNGGTKKACYNKTIKALKSGGRRKRRGTSRRRRSSWCAKWGYSHKRGVPVCRKRKTRKRR
jgi:hypothetical protein